MPSKWDKLKGKYPPTPLGSMGHARDPKFVELVDAAKAEYSCLTLGELMTELNNVDTQKDELAAAEKEVNVKIEALGRLILGIFETQDTTSVKTSFGKTVYTRIEPYVGIENREQFESHIENIPDYDYLWSVHPSSLASLVKDMIEKGLDDQIPPGLKIYLKSQICIKKS